MSAARFNRDQGTFFECDRESRAVFSPCRVYRYTLTRGLSTDERICNFIMLNPSTADETVNDPTIKKCIKYATAWGYGILVVTNLFAFRATDPSELARCPEPIGAENDRHIMEQARAAAVDGCVLLAWGNEGILDNRSHRVRAMLEAEFIPLHCLKVTKKGEPQHPLYLKDELRPTPYE